MYRLQSMCFAATVATAALLGAPVQAQETGAVRGTVTLVENGGPVHGAVILVIGSGALGLTDEQGAFEIPGVPAGSYEVLAQREHLTAVRQAITVSPGETALVDFALGLSPVHEDVTVTASATGTETTFEAFNAVTTLDSFDLARASSGSLGEALQNEPGIASRSFGPGSSRPVIRGFDGDRVLILEDGVRTGDLSSQSGDHGVTIDPNSAERIEIVRGPATLLYGSNAVGGLVNVITPHESYRESLFEGTRAQFGTDGGSANRQAGTNGSLQRSQGNVLVWAGGSLRRSGDYDTPEGTIENSATELTNAQAGLGWFGDRFFASGGLTFEDGRYGVPFADEFHGHPEEEADHAEEAEDGTEEEHAEEIEVDLDSRRRVGRFDVGLRNLSSRVVDGVRVTLNVIDWNHDELEIEQGLENIGTRFTNRTYIMRADVDQQQTERLSGKFGAWTQVRGFEAVGAEALAPRTDQTSFAAFAYEEVNLGHVRLQFGGRIEQNDYRTGERVGGHDEDEDALHHDDADDDHAQDHDAEEEEHGLEAPDPRDRQFRGASTSIGLHTDLGADSAFVANLTHSHRSPALEELLQLRPARREPRLRGWQPESRCRDDARDRPEPPAPDPPRPRRLQRLLLRHRQLHLRGPDRRGGGQPAGPALHPGRQPVRRVRRQRERPAGRTGLGDARDRPRRCGVDDDERAAAAHPAAARYPEPRHPLRRIHAQPATGVRGAAGRRVPGRDGDRRLLRRQPAGVVRLAAAAHGAHPVVHGLQPDERALSESHVLHQGPGSRDRLFSPTQLSRQNVAPNLRAQARVLGLVRPNPPDATAPSTPLSMRRASACIRNRSSSPCAYSRSRAPAARRSTACASAPDPTPAPDGPPPRTAPGNPPGADAETRTASGVAES